jgi:tRNA 2-thiouridine synthesizing protein B
MSTLHTVNKSPFEKYTLNSCFGHLVNGDAVLMIEDGVLGARKGSAAEPTVQAAMKSASVYALVPDLEARGIKAGDVIEGIQLVGYGGFADLVAQHRSTVSWL